MKTVLLVDNDESIREAFTIVLESDGYRVLAFESGLTALAFLKTCSHRPSLALIDLEMPGMTGVQLVAEMSKDEDLCRIPVTIVTASRCAVLGAPVMHKPVDINVLLNYVATMMGDRCKAA